jgi:hypothetical protein
MANIIGEQIHEYVAQQINHRQHAHGSGVPGNDRLAEYITYLNSKTAWVKLASGSNIHPDRIRDENLNETLQWNTLAKRNILFGGISRLENRELIQRGTDPIKDNLYDPYAGVYNVNNTTNPDNPEFGLVPMPGIESAEIKCLNRGSIKKATVKIKCYSPEQFKTLNLLYLRIGYTVLLEWGNSLYLNNDKNNPKLESMDHTLIEANDGFFSTDATYNSILDQIKIYRSKKLGNYDALLSKVVNFSWDFSSDGSYDITLELISLGDVIESLKTNITPSSYISNFIKESYILFSENNNEGTDDIDPTPTDNILSAYLFIQKLYLNSQNDDDEDRIKKKEISVSVKDKKIELGSQFIRPTSNGLDFIKTDTSPTLDTVTEVRDWMNEHYPGSTEVSSEEDFTNANDKVEFYIEGILFTGDNKYKSHLQINEKFTPFEELKSSRKDICYLNYTNSEGDTSINDLGFYMRLGHLFDFINQYIIPINDKTNEKQIIIDNGMFNSIMHTFPFQISLDPRVCIVNNQEPVNSKIYFPELKTWKKTDKDYAWTMNIYVNHFMILSILSSNTDDKGNLALFDFLSSICTELNKALGGINNLEPVIDEEDNTIRIIDHNYQPKKERKSYGLELYGYNPKFTSSNFVRNFSLKTEITPEFATMATIGSTAGGYVKGTENTMFSKWNKGIIDRYKEKWSAADKDSRLKEEEEDEAVTEYLKNFYQKDGSNPFGWTKNDVGDWSNPDVGDNSQYLNDEIINNNVAIVTEFFKYCQYHLQKEEEKYASPHSGFIPINLGITMDGISGIKIYNALNVDTKFLPSDYPENLQFIIKGVNHKISNQDWETSLETIVIAKSEDKDGVKVLSYDDIRTRILKLLRETSISITPPSITESTADDVLEENVVSNPPLSSPSISETNSKLEQYTKKSSIDYFKSYGEKKSQCGSYTYNIARNLAEKLKSKSIEPITGNHAYSQTLRKNLSNLGIYQQDSLTPVGIGLTPSQASKKANDITKIANYGDVLIYYATPEPRGDSPNYRYHAQIYTGNQYDTLGGKGWTSSNQKNYGTDFVYASRTTSPYTMYWFRIKDEYKN